MSRLNIGLCILALVFGALYIFNPTGTATYDPRARMLGYNIYSIPGNSMSPTISKGNYVIVKTSAYARKIPDRKDIIVFKRPDVDVEFVKRLIANEGELIEIIDTVVYIDGVKLSESYIAADDLFPPRRLMDVKFEIPAGHFFVLGDNRGNSLDSRQFGAVPYSNLIGEVTKIID